MVDLDVRDTVFVYTENRKKRKWTKFWWSQEDCFSWNT